MMMELTEMLFQETMYGREHASIGLKTPLVPEKLSQRERELLDWIQLEEELSHAVKEYDTPGEPGVSLDKATKLGGDPTVYRSVVGKVMYLVSKIWIEGSNPARELARHFALPGKEHWAAMERLVGYLKKNKDNIKMKIRKPKELRMMSMVDSN